MKTPTNLGQALYHYRRAENLSLRELSDKIGISAPTLMRIEKGADCELRVFLRVVNWLVAVY